MNGALFNNIHSQFLTNLIKIGLLPLTKEISPHAKLMLRDNDGGGIKTTDQKLL